MHFSAQTDRLSYHAGMLVDTARVSAYHRAIEAVVKEGDVVVDVGAGTGLLSFFACQAGARRVHAIEHGSIIEVAKELSRHNGFEDRVVFHRGTSYDIDLDEPADVLITETLWNFGLGEGILGVLLDARDRLLKDGARIVPDWIEMVVAPVESADAYRWIDAWGDLHGIDLAPVREYAVNNVYNPQLSSEALLGEPATLHRLDLAQVETSDMSAVVIAHAGRDGIMHGIGGWFVSGLADGITLTTAPTSRPSSWGQAFLPLARPRPVRAGDEVEISVSTAANGGVWSWKLGRSAGGSSSLWGAPSELGVFARRQA